MFLSRERAKNVVLNSSIPNSFKTVLICTEVIIVENIFFQEMTSNFTNSYDFKTRNKIKQVSVLFIYTKSKSGV